MQPIPLRKRKENSLMMIGVWKWVNGRKLKGCCLDKRGLLGEDPLIQRQGRPAVASIYLLTTYRLNQDYPGNVRIFTDNPPSKIG